MIYPLPNVPDHVAAFEAKGSVTGADFETVVFPVVAEKVNKYHELNYLFYLHTDMSEFSGGAWISDMALGLKNISAWNRAAIITELKGVQYFTDVFSKMMVGEFKTFEPSQMQEAVDWVSGQTGKAQEAGIKDKNTYENLYSKDAIEKLKEIAEGARFCFFTTAITDKVPHSVPMALQSVCDQGNLWFISSKDSTRDHQIAEDDRVYLHFSNNGSSEYLYVFGKAETSDDRALIEKYWTPFAKAWFEGKDDPAISIIKVKPSEAYYWDNKSSKIMSTAKRLSNAFLGTEFDDGGVEGGLQL